MRQDHKAGEKLFVDFPGLTIPIYDERTLEVSFRAELFVAVLGASSYLYAEALRSQALEHWCHAHEHAFEFLGGCPAIVVPDNLRSAVTKAHRYEPDLNATYQEMAQHYGVVIIPARPYKPRDKAKVEVGVQIVERWIMARLRKERFTRSARSTSALASSSSSSTRPFKKLEGSRAASSKRSTARRCDRCPKSPTSSPRGAGPRSTSITTSKSSATTTRSPTTWSARSSTCAPAPTVEMFVKNRRVATHQRSYGEGVTSLMRRTCRVRTAATASGRPGASCAGPRRPGPRRPSSLMTYGRSTSPRTGVPLGARGDATRQEIRPRAPRGGVRAGARACARSPTSPSPRSCSTDSTNSPSRRCCPRRTRHPRQHPGPKLLPMKEETMLTHHRRGPQVPATTRHGDRTARTT